MSVGINIENAVKKFGNNTIIHGLTLHVREGEFFTLLGPSGCGKTTLLRMIAGFNSIESGTFSFNDKVINNIDPAKRNIGRVFQNYAIFPHLSVRKNVEFGLQNRKLSKKEVAERADKYMKLVHVDEYAERMPDRLSGGQQQRVALARALCIQPDVLLMDEPLSNLDAKLRVEMRSVIKQIQHEVGITTVYVTHDQEEAMAVSDRIAVMNAGVIQHIGTPKNIYQRPANTFVATFIGRTNLFNGKLKVRGDVCEITFDNGYAIEMKNIRPEMRRDQDVIISIRPEEFVVCGANENGLQAEVTDHIFLGLNTHYTVKVGMDQEADIIQESSIDSIIPKGSTVSLKIKTDKINIFSADGSQNILTGVNDDKEAGDKACV
ncbi:MAG TPA: ABC transporter ATP-binding protein [Candidatus Faecousia intestinigallinarum]|nr:ABC transporter ATP-binding protein [Candidatus Faecousia intestinigallinarum]